MEFDKIAHVNLLYDFYGQLLANRQREVMTLYYEENLSLAEIAEEFSISRQAVHDALKNGEKALTDYEAKLGLVQKFEKSKVAIGQIDAAIDEIIVDSGNHKKLSDKLQKIKTIIDKLDQ